MFGNDWG